MLTSRKASPEDPLRPGEADLVEWVDGLYSEAERAKNEQARPDEWEDWTATYWGDQWPANLPVFKSPIVVNEIKALMLQEISDLTDSRISIYVQRDPQTKDRDENVEKSMRAWWRTSFADLAVMNAAVDGLLYPLGFLQNGWDPSLQQGQGDTILRARDPLSVFPDPDATCDDDLAYMVLTDVLDLWQLRKMFPVTGWRVDAEGDYSVKMDAHDRRPHPGLPGFKTPLYSGSHTGSRMEGYKKARARLMTCFVQDDATELDAITLASGQMTTRPRQTYPYGRLIQIANQRVLFDGPNPYEGPVVTRVLLQPSVHAYWPASSFVSEYEWIQKTANKMDSMVAENALRLNVGEKVADADSGIDPKTYQAIPGQVLMIKPGSKVETHYSAPMPPDMIQAGERFREMIRKNSGFSTRRQGGGVPGNVSAEMVETEISQSMGLTRLRGRLLHQAVQRVVENDFRLKALFYTTPRHVPYIVDNQWQTAPWVPIPDRKGYAIHVDEASYQIKSRSAMQRLALILARFQKLPTADLLKILEFPDAEGIAQRLQQELILLAMARGKGGKKK